MYRHKYLSGYNWVFLENSIDTIIHSHNEVQLKFNFSIEGAEGAPVWLQKKLLQVKKTKGLPQSVFPASPWDRSHTTPSGPELTM